MGIKFWLFPLTLIVALTTLALPCECVITVDYWVISKLLSKLLNFRDLFISWMPSECHSVYRNDSKRVQSNFSKCFIAGLSPLMAAGGFFWSWPHLIRGYFGPPTSLPEQHLNGFSHFCRAHPCDRHTDPAACDICHSELHCIYAAHAVRPNNRRKIAVHFC